MASALAHRGPDSSGVWVEEKAGIALGNRRLAIIDLSEKGHQPMESADGRWVLSFNGEIYNHNVLRQALPKGGRAFRGSSDTEVLVEAMAAWGVRAALAKAHGMFALAVWDRERRVLWLARDRLGEKPLYYGWMGHTFLFGSELKSLCTHPAFSPAIDHNALTLYLRYGYIPTPFSIYRGVHKLTPGTTLQITAEVVGSLPEPEPYWVLPRATGSSDRVSELSTSEILAQLEDVLAKSVRSQMIADVPLGAFLSGGIDSSTVVALMQAQSKHPIRTFSIGFEEMGFDEAVYAKQVAHHLQTDHTELYVTPAEALNVVPLLSEMYDEPFGDSSQVPTHLVSALARRSVTVALSGDGGDELFGGYTRYQRLATAWRAIQLMPRFVRQLGARGLAAVPGSWWAAGRDAISLVLPRRVSDGLPSWRAPHTLAEVLSADSPERAYLLLVSHWRRPGEIVVAGSEPTVAITDRRLWGSSSDVTSWAMYVDALQYLPDDILVKVDRAAMATSLEVRVPMLDPDVVDFALSIPARLRRMDGKSKWPIRQVLYKHVPPHLVDRPKMGFGVPIHTWLRGPLRGWAEELLKADALAAGGILNPSRIREVWDQHQSGSHDHAYPLWTVLMLQDWRRRWNI